MNLKNAREETALTVRRARRKFFDDLGGSAGAISRTVDGIAVDRASGYSPTAF